MTSTMVQSVLPLSAGTALTRGVRYRSASGRHTLEFRADGDLVVTTTAGVTVWALRQVLPSYAKAARIDVQADGNLVAHDTDGKFLWSALGEKPDPKAQLQVTPRGVLQLVAGSTVRWSGDSEPRSSSRRVFPLVAGTVVQRDAKYLSGSGRHYLKFQLDGDVVVNSTVDGTTLWALRTVCPAYAKAARVEVQADGNFVVHDADGKFLWSALSKDPKYTDRLVLNARGALQLTGQDGVARWSSDGNLAAEPWSGAEWTQSRTLTEPKITVFATKAVSTQALDAVATVYDAITSRLTAAYPKASLDNLDIHLVNGEPWSDLKDLRPVGFLSTTVDKYGVVEGDDLRGGTAGDWLWLDEQLICTTGVGTRNDAYAKGLRDHPDHDKRTFDQVVHEFGHAIANRYGLGQRVAQLFPNDPVEGFPWAVQHLFGTPSGSNTAEQQALLKELFTSAAGFADGDATVTDKPFA